MDKNVFKPFKFTYSQILEYNLKTIDTHNMSFTTVANLNTLMHYAEISGEDGAERLNKTIDWGKILNESMMTRPQEALQALKNLPNDTVKMAINKMMSSNSLQSKWIDFMKIQPLKSTELLNALNAKHNNTSLNELAQKASKNLLNSDLSLYAQTKPMDITQGVRSPNLSKIERAYLQKVMQSQLPKDTLLENFQNQIKNLMNQSPDEVALVFSEMDEKWRKLALDYIVDHSNEFLLKKTSNRINECILCSKIGTFFSDQQVIELQKRGFPDSNIMEILGPTKVDLAVKLGYKVSHRNNMIIFTDQQGISSFQDTTSYFFQMKSISRPLTFSEWVALEKSHKVTQRSFYSKLTFGDKKKYIKKGLMTPEEFVLLPKREITQLGGQVDSVRNRVILQDYLAKINDGQKIFFKKTSIGGIQDFKYKKIIEEIQSKLRSPLSEERLRYIHDFQNLMLKEPKVYNSQLLFKILESKVDHADEFFKGVLANPSVKLQTVSEILKSSFQLDNLEKIPWDSSNLEDQKILKQLREQQIQFLTTVDIQTEKYINEKGIDKPTKNQMKRARQKVIDSIIKEETSKVIQNNQSLRPVVEQIMKTKVYNALRLNQVKIPLPDEIQTRAEILEKDNSLTGEKRAVILKRINQKLKQSAYSGETGR